MFCETSEMSFSMYENDTGYDLIKKNSVLKVEGFGYWMVNEVTETDFGNYKTKDISAYSYEVTLCRKSISLEQKTYKLYDALNPNTTLLGLIASQTNWKLAHVDSTLLNKMRNMEFDNVSVYDALMNDITETYKCFFVFDTDEMEIYCYDQEAVIKKTNINLSFKNLIKELKIKSSSEDICTALYVTGADGCNIAMVNPIGNNMMYDFSYFYDEMDADLKEAVQTWASKVSYGELEYMLINANYLYRMIEKEKLDVDITIKEAEIKAIKDAQSVAISQNNEARMQELKEELSVEEGNLLLLKSNRDSQKAYADSYKQEKEDFVKDMAISKNFTAEQVESLQFYMQYGTYENENFIYTSDMSTEDKFDWSDALYKQAKKDFTKVSRPTYNYELSLCNFITNKKYSKFVSALELGKSVNLEYKKNQWINPRILKIELDWDDPNSTSITLSDTFTVIDNVCKFTDDFTAQSKITNKVALSIGNWQEPVKKGLYDTINNYINNALSLANQEIINADNQEFSIGSYGIRGRVVDEEGGYSDKQIAIINNLIAFTDDGWNSTKTALGEIAVGDQMYYGLAAEAIMGRLVAADRLVISNSDTEENATFTVDGDGAKLINADLSVEKGNSKIILSPTDGFKIKKKDTSDPLITDKWDDVFTADNGGNLSIKGKMQVDEDSVIAGWKITKTQFKSEVCDNYIDVEGKGKLGLMTWGTSDSGNWANFDGNIYARNLYANNGTSSVNVFTLGSDGYTMGGGWLSIGSVGTDRRAVADWDALYAKKIKVDDLEAKTATLEQAVIGVAYIKDLTAGQIVAEGLTTPISFGGSFKVYHPNNINITATMTGVPENITIDSTHKGDLMSIGFTAGAYIYMDAYGGVKFAHRQTDGTISESDWGTIHAGVIHLNGDSSSMTCKKIEVYPNSGGTGISVYDGGISTKTLNTSDQLTVGGDLVVNGSNIIVAGSNEKGSGDYRIYYLDHDGQKKTIHVVKGIITGI